MKITKYVGTFRLEGAAIDEVSEKVRDFAERIGTERKNVLRLRLTVEDLLLKWQKHFGEEAAFRLLTGTRFGRPYITLELPGEKSDPIGISDEFGEASARLLAGLGLYPVYDYRQNTNVLTIKLQKRRRNPFAGPLGAAILGILVGVIGLQAPEAFRNGCRVILLDPLYAAFLGILTTLVGPMIFLSVAWGIYGIGDASMLGKIGKKLLVRFLGSTMLTTLIALSVLVPLFRLPFASVGLETSGLGKITELVLGIFPKNIVSPFLEGNTIQIIVLAAAIGCGMLILGNQAELAANVIGQLNDVIHYLMELIGKGLPALIFLIVLRMILSGTVSSIQNVWKPILFAVFLTLVIASGFVLYLCIREKVKVGVLLKKSFPSFFIALTTASSAAAFGTLVSTCEHDYGIHPRVTNFGVPLSVVLFKPVSTIGFSALSLYFAKMYGLEVSPLWFLSTAIVIVILSVALPPVSGGAIVCYTILLMQLGIPDEALGIAMVADLFIDFSNTGFNTLMRQLALIRTADQVGMLDREKLRG